LVAEALEVAISAAREAGAERIQRLTFVLPTGGHVTAESVETLVEIMSRGTPAEGAQVSMEFVDGAHVPDLALASIDVERPQAETART
jgi:Zn finger protein HypA/HybF involved in hydrogenase expression